MNIPGMKVSDILAGKMAEIQSRLPLRMNIPDTVEEDFSTVLDKALKSNGNAAPLVDPALLSSFNQSDLIKSVPGAKYPLVSGSYESVYPRLTSDQINELMPRIDKAIEGYSERFNLDPKLVRSVMKQESSFQPFALSTSGAMGLMQLMPDTAQWLGVDDPYNIEQNIRGGTQYLRDQLNTFDGDLELALAAYNAGPNAVKKYDGIPPYEQTQNYVRRVLQYYDMYKTLD